MLTDLVATLRQSLGLLHKQDIQPVARSLTMPNGSLPIPLGDDCAAIPDGDSFLLLAAEGILPSLVETDPWFAGWCAVMVNVSDIYAMGGRPIAVVDTLWSPSPGQTAELLAGMQAAAQTYQVPIVGGHTNGHSPYSALSVAILGRAQRLITSFQAQPGDRLLAVLDSRGALHPHYPFWNAATQADPGQLRQDLSLLPALAEAGLCDAGKDISMGGIVGTAVMLLETSGCGAVIHVESIPCPATVPLSQWLVCFPSYGFLLSVRPQFVEAVQQLFCDRHLICADIGPVTDSRCLMMQAQSEQVEVWNLAQQPLTGFGHV